MTNYWETNFEVSLGGFPAATFQLTRGPSLADAPAAPAACRALANEFFSFPANE